MPLAHVNAVFPSPASTLGWIQSLDNWHPVKKATASHCRSLLCLFFFPPQPSRPSKYC